MLNKIKNKNYYLLLIIFSFIFLIFIDENGPLYHFSNYADTCVYYEIGKMILNDCEMYVDFIDVKGPYMYFIGALSFLINKSFIAFFIFDLVSIILYNIYSFKIFKIYFDNDKSFVYALLSNLLSLYFIYVLGNPEFIFIGIFTYFLYWILSGGINKNNKITFLIFGIIFAFIFLIKIVYIIPFGLIAIYYIFINRKILKKVLYEISFFILGVFLGSIPLLIYELKNNCLGITIFRYLESAFKYSNCIEIEFSIDLLFKLIFPSLLFIGIFFNLFLLYFKKEYLVSFLYFFGFLLVIIVGKRYYPYYSYFFVSFIPFIFILIDKMFCNKKIFKYSLLLISIFICCFNFINIINNKGFGLDKTKDYQYCFYKDFKNDINEDTVILNMLCVDTLITKYFDCQPSYKYFNIFNNNYNNFKEAFENNLSLIKNKEADYISILTFEDEIDNNKEKVVVISKTLKNEILYLKNFEKAIEENYNLIKRYSVYEKFNNLSKDSFIEIYVPKEDS